MPAARPSVLVAALGVAVLSLALVAGALTFQLHRTRAAAAANALRADSLSAANDTMRAVALSARDRARILGDSLQAMERRGVQLASVAPDALDKATGRTSVARAHITVTPHIVTTTATSTPTTVATNDVREAAFHVDSSHAVASPRFTADVAVRVPPPPSAASMRLAVALEPITLSPRVQCGAPDAGGIRPASLAVVAPVGVTLDVAPLDVDVHACNPEFGRPTGVRVSLGTASLMALGAALVTAVVVAGR